VTGCDGAEMRLDRVSEYARLALHHEIFNLHAAIGRGEVDVRHADTDRLGAPCQPFAESCVDEAGFRFLDRHHRPHATILHLLLLLSSNVRPRIARPRSVNRTRL
jgi:hypothetical protein